MVAFQDALYSKAADYNNIVLTAPVTEFQLAGRLISGSKLHLLISTSLINLAYFLS